LSPTESRTEACPFHLCKSYCGRIIYPVEGGRTFL
jgi:hypothetical protein